MSEPLTTARAAVVAGEDHGAAILAARASLRAAEDRLRDLVRECSHGARQIAFGVVRCTVCDSRLGWECTTSPDQICHFPEHGKIAVRLVTGEIVPVPADFDANDEPTCCFCDDPEERA